jgi:phosphohistidine phosphatase
MKTVYIIRHAKSGWGDSTLSDMERPLNERGKTDAEDMSKRLKNKDAAITLFISSPAKRALKTAKAFCKEYQVNTEDLMVVNDLYHAPAETFYEVIGNINDKHDRVALFSHNPGISEFVNSLDAGVRIDDMPTCAIFAISIDSNSWADFKSAHKKFLFFDYPKNR